MRPERSRPKTQRIWLVLLFMVFPAGADPGERLMRIWDSHLASPEIRPGAKIRITPEHGPMDVEATWPDGVSGTYSLERPTTFRFVEFVGEQSMRVEDEYADVLELSRRHLDHFRRNRARILREKLALLDAPAPTLAPGERVRVRRRGAIHAGRLRSNGRRARVEIEGETFEVPATAVFRWLGPHPRTVGSTTRWVTLGPTRGLARRYLDAVARWSSTPEFGRLDEREQIRLLTRAVLVFMPWHYFGLRVDEFGPVGLGTLLARGYAVCRHLAAITALVLNEAGFDARIVSASNHAWVEVGDLVVDASVSSLRSDVFVGERAGLLERETPEGRRFAETHYLSPERRSARWDCEGPLEF